MDDAEGKTIQAEARHRLEQGAGIRVFSRPERLKQWLEDHGLRLQDRAALITDAGQLVPGLTPTQHGVEIFVHCPFAKRMDDGQVEDRNDDCLVLHLTFSCETTTTRAILAADITHEILADIVNVTRSKGRQSRLEWDVVKLPHHCSYLSIGPDRGTDETKPVPEIAWLYENQGQDRGILVSSSNPIPAEGSDEDEASDPPHRQAANYYRSASAAIRGEFVVTMQHPRPGAPMPLIIEIGTKKAMLQKSQQGGVAAVLSRPAPRAGRS